MTAGCAEHLEILHAVAADLLERLYKQRKYLQAADLASLHLSEKVAKRFLEKFPLLHDALKEKDAGYELFLNNAHTILADLEPFFTVLCQLLEFRDHALVLLHEMSNPKTILSFSLELNELAFSGYYNLMLQYAKLHILLGVLASPHGRGKLALAAYAKAHAVMNQGRVPAEYEALAKYLCDYEQPIPKLQDDLSKARLRVADTLLPLGMQIIRLSDPGHLRQEGVLSPLGSGGGGAAGAAKPADDPLFARLTEARQWLVYGLLLYPDDLAEAGAIDLLLALLSVSYVLPVYGSEVIYPHSEFDVDYKTAFRWIKKKDEAKKFASQIKESRIQAFRGAGKIHATSRSILITKLSHLHAALTDAPALLMPKFATMLTALKLAREEVIWWTLHADAIPEELTKKEASAEKDPAIFHPASVQALLRLMSALTTDALAQKAVLTEAAAARMQLHKDVVRERSGQLGESVALPHEVAPVLREMPSHLALAGEVGIDLRGVRLNVLRLVCELSRPHLLALAASNKALSTLLKELHAISELSLVIDTTEALLRSATEPTALLSDPAKLERIFVCALDAKPTDCLVMLSLAARAGSISVSEKTSPLPSMMQRMGERIHSLLRELADHFRSQRTNPHGVGSILDVVQKCCTLCKALDTAQPIVYHRSTGPPVSISLQAWLREQFEGFVEGHVQWILFPSPNSTEPRMPTIALSLFADLSHALAVLEPYINLDAHAMLDAVVVRELGALEVAGPDVVANEPEVDTNEHGGLAVRAEGPIIDEESVERAKATRDAGDEAQSPTLIQRLKLWLRKLAESCQRPDGPQYVPGRLAFGKSALDVVQISALSRLVGTRGMKQLGQVLLDVAAESPVAIGSILSKNAKELDAIATTFEKSRALDPLYNQLSDLNILLASSRALGIILVSRSLFQQGIRSAKAELLPPAVPSFIAGLGQQQLPDGQRAGMALPQVTELLTAFGQIGGAENDAYLVQLLADRCGIPHPQDGGAALWASLPYALALMFTLPEWVQAPPKLAEDGIAGNVHCIVHALHALLCMADPHMNNGHPELPAEGAAFAQGRFAHRRFLEVASLVLLRQRQFLMTGQLKPQDVPARERCIASMVLVCEQLVELAEPLGYGDLQAFLPYSLVLSSYTTVSQPVSVVAGLEAHFATAVDVSDARGRQMSGRL